MNNVPGDKPGDVPANFFSTAADNMYATDDTRYRGENGASPLYRLPSATSGSLADRTWGGRFINPARVKDTSGLWTWGWHEDY